MNKLTIFIICILFFTLGAADTQQQQVGVGVCISYPLNEEVILKLNDSEYFNFFSHYKFELLGTENYYEEVITIQELQIVLADSVNFKGQLMITTSNKMYLIELPELRVKLNI